MVSGNAGAGKCCFVSFEVMSADYFEEIDAPEYASPDTIEELAYSMIRAEGRDPKSLASGEKWRYIDQAREVVREHRLSQLEAMYGA